MAKSEWSLEKLKDRAKDSLEKHGARPRRLRQTVREKDEGVGLRHHIGVLLLGTTSVGPLELGDLLIIERDGSTAVPLLTHEVESSGGLMTTQACHPLREIDDVVSSISDPGAGIGDLQSEKLPAVRSGKLLARMLHHCFERNEL